MLLFVLAASTTSAILRVLDTEIDTDIDIVLVLKVWLLHGSTGIERVAVVVAPVVAAEAARHSVSEHLRARPLVVVNLVRLKSFHILKGYP